MKRWYDLDISEVASQTDTDPRTGLSEKDAKRRLEENGANTVFPLPAESARDDLRKTSISALSILLALTCLLSAIFDRELTTVVPVLLLAINYLTILVTYRKAKQLLTRLGRDALPTAKVIRNGRMMLIHQHQVVVGDLICLSAGDIVPCDARLVEDSNLVVLESGITNADGPVKKDTDFKNIRNIPPHEALNMVYASTIVRSGRGKAIACRCGKDCYVCSVGKNKAAASYDNLTVFGSLRRLSYYVTLFSIILTFVLTVLNMLPAFHRFNALNGLLYALAFGCAAMTEFYSIFGYIIVSIGIFGSLRQSGRISTGVLIKNAEKLSIMRRLTTVIIPPEAVVSESELTLRSIYRDADSDEIFEKNALGFDPACSEIIRMAVISTGLYDKRLISLAAAGDNQYSSEEDAILRTAKENGLYTHELDEEFPLCEHLGKSEFCPFETTLVRNGAENRVIVRGNAEEILFACSFYRGKDGTIHKLTDISRSRLSTIASQMMRERGRVVAVATNYSFFSTLVRLSDTLSGMTFEGFLCFDEPLLKGAARTVKRLRNAGIRVVLFTSDHSERNIVLAEKLGIVDDEYSQIADMRADKPFSDGLPSAKTLFQNVDARAAQSIIAKLQQEGERVGYLGLEFDGIIAMRQADVCYTQSIILSGRDPRKKPGRRKNASPDLPLSVSKAGEGAPCGCDALRFVSDAIVSSVTGGSTDGGLNAVCSSVERARTVYRNINRLFSYLITVNCTRLLLLLSTFFSGNILLTPVQILLDGLIFDLAAVLIIAFGRPDRDILSPTHRGKEGGLTAKSSFRALLTGVFFGVCLILFGALLTLTRLASGSTVCAPIFLALLAASPLILLESGRDRSLFAGDVSFSNMLSFAMLASALLIAAGLIFPKFGAWFGIYRLSPLAYLMAIAAALVLVAFIELFKHSENRRAAEGSSGSPKRSWIRGILSAPPVQKLRSTVRSLFSRLGRSIRQLWKRIFDRKKG